MQSHTPYPTSHTIIPRTIKRVAPVLGVALLLAGCGTPGNKGERLAKQACGCTEMAFADMKTCMKQVGQEHERLVAELENAPEQERLFRAAFRDGLKACASEQMQETLNKVEDGLESASEDVDAAMESLQNEVDKAMKEAERTAEDAKEAAKDATN